MKKCYECGSENLVYLRYYPFLIWYENGEEKKLPYARPYLEKAYRCIDCGETFGEEGRYLCQK